MRIANMRDESSSLPADTYCPPSFLNERNGVDRNWPGSDSADRRRQIVSEYLKILENMNQPIAMESELPFSKEQIGRAIFDELLDDPFQDSRHHLEIAYIQLENFISSEDYAVLTEFKNASRVAQEMEEVGDPASIIMSAQVMKGAKGESAVQIQERISENIRERRMQLREIGCSVCSAIGD